MVRNAVVRNNAVLKRLALPAMEVARGASAPYLPLNPEVHE